MNVKKWVHETVMNSYRLIQMQLSFIESDEELKSGFRPKMLCQRYVNGMAGTQFCTTEKYFFPLSRVVGTSSLHYWSSSYITVWNCYSNTYS